MLPSQIFKERLINVKNEMINKGIDFFMVFNGLNIYYLTGFPRGRVLLLNVDKDPVLVVSELEFDEAAETFKFGEIIPIKANLSLTDTIASVFNGLDRKGNVALERQYITMELHSSLSKKLGIVDFIDLSNYILNLRSIKNPYEIELIKMALKISEKSIKCGLDNFHEGMSEIELAGEIEYSMRKNGAFGYAFDSIVASGPRSAYPHGSASSRIIERGDLVVIDIGAKYYGYCSDITRTIVIGSMNTDIKRIFEIIVEAIDTAIDKLCAGVTGAEVDAVARKVIENNDYGKYFTHSLGHGIGLAVHEEPGLNSRNNSPLRDGNIVTVEPGIYIKGFGGVRIEEMVLVRESKCELLNSLSRLLF
ncbi:MAG: Xaa-Pro peptidase family protein [Candidatus Methanomethylicia archaeon]|nr:Xaa-Pro peptidase family protein [Candidatus Methanomethylicia archaeon]